LPQHPPAGEVVISMRPVSVFANGPDSEIERLRAQLRGPRRQAARAAMVLLSLHELTSAQIVALLECHPGTARRWIARFCEKGLAGLADRPRCGRPRLGGRRLTGRIAALLGRPGPWTLPRIRRCLGWPHGEVLKEGRDKLGMRFRLADGAGWLCLVYRVWVLKVLRRPRHPRWHGR